MASRNLAYVSSAMLKWARGETPFDDLETVAAKTHINIKELEEWEEGEALPSITNAKKLAFLYDVPLACFFLSNPPEKKLRPYVDRRTSFGAREKTISYKLWHEMRNAMFNREAAVELLSDETKRLFTVPSVTTTDSVEAIATVIRTFLDIKLPFKYKNEYSNNAFNYFRDLIEKKGIMVTQLMGIEKDEIRALSIYFETMPIIAINGKDWERSKVFSLFHEMAHLIRRSSSLCSISFDNYDDAEESICNNIAAATLLPEKEFRIISSKYFSSFQEWNDLCLVKIADCFGTSTSVVLRRLFKLEIITPEYFYQRLSAMREDFNNNSTTKKGEFKVEYHYKYLSKEGRLFPRVILSAYSRGALSYGEMCRTLNLNPIHIGNIEQAVMYN